MTTPESITVSLDWAKRLKEAGWPQDDSVWYWMCDQNGLRDAVLLETRKYPDKYGECSASPTAEEILRRLPKWEAGPYTHTDLSVGAYVRVADLKDGRGPFGRIETEDSLANAAAAMYCYLADQNLLPSFTT